MDYERIKLPADLMLVMQDGCMPPWQSRRLPPGWVVFCAPSATGDFTKEFEARHPLIPMLFNMAASVPLRPFKQQKLLALLTPARQREILNIPGMRPCNTVPTFDGFTRKGFRDKASRGLGLVWDVPLIQMRDGTICSVEAPEGSCEKSFVDTLRHEHSNYDEEIRKAQTAYERIQVRKSVYTLLAQMFPQLRYECQAQLESRIDGELE